MKIVIAPDSFKESLTAMQVANAIEKGFKTIFPHAEYCKVPMADGGEGTVQAMIDATNGKKVTLKVSGPLGEPVEAFYGILADNKTAVIEMAAASGLHHVPRSKRNPLTTSSYGTGELIKDALNRGMKHIIIGLGGSATNDAGAGMLTALGIKLLNAQGQPIPSGGAGLSELVQVDMSQCAPKLAQCKIDVACDVDNPLCGPLGASAIFGPQKGATTEMINELDNALNHFAQVSSSLFPSKQFHTVKGSGAAGGMGFGLLTYLNATLTPGITLVTQTVGLAKHCQDADLVITGEGRIDGQTIFGKTPMGVLQVAQQYNVPTIGIAGSLGDNANAILTKGMQAIFAIIPGVAPLEVVLEEAETNLINTSQNIAATLNMSL
ncbi:glycerate kinase [Shewanella gaetbuli]|uniref:Glycerate kinase n=1 Tax=Shewanella gaetbuli TaxID=220752 RepID=A0A9X1ZWD1_9GAMM|nr:glycerate kinase [Shewanella gaetbuli]MCL1143616.1 glycerate kinase [Shewanella gaetbuli]